MNSATADGPNWRARRGQQLARGWVGASSWHSMSHLQKIDAAAVERKRTSQVRGKKRAKRVQRADWVQIPVPARVSKARQALSGII